MRIVYHLGAHGTDEDRLLRCLLKNRDRLRAEAILVPGPARYRTQMRDLMTGLKGAAATPDIRDSLLEKLMDQDRARRLILSFDSFLAYPQWVLRGTLYPGGGERLRAMTGLFPGFEAEAHLAIRNPASFLPALFQRQKGKSYAQFTEGCDPQALLWSDLVTRLVRHNPGVPLTVWCDEDSPLLWDQILRAVSGHAPGPALVGAEDFPASLLTPEGQAELAAALSADPPPDETGRRRLLADLLERFALPEKTEMELDLPGWTEDYVARLSDSYDRDVERIAALPGVTVLRP